MTIILNNTGNLISREERKKINDNWDRIIAGLTEMQYQINMLAGGEDVQKLLEAIRKALDDIAEAQHQAEEVIANAANAAENADTKATEAETASQNANIAAQKALDSIQDVLDALTDLEKVKQDTITATQNANDATVSAAQASTEAKGAAKHSIEETEKAIKNINDTISASLIDMSAKVDTAVQNADNATERANIAVGDVERASEAIKGWGTATVWNAETVYERNNIVTDNGSTWQSLRQNVGVAPVEGEDWRCLARKGVDGTGAVSSVNGRFPDENGNVQLDLKQGTVQKVNGKGPNGEGEVILTASDLGTFPGSLLEDGSVELQKLSQDVQDAIDKAGGGNSYFAIHVLPTTMEAQKTWNLPTDSYDANADSLVVFHNGNVLDPVSWTVTGDTLTGYHFNIPDNPIVAIEDNNVLVVVLRNTISGDPNTVSGTVLTDGSVGLQKLGQDVQDAINNAGTKIDIIDALDSDRTDAVLSAKQGNVLRKMIDSVPKTEVVNDLTTGGIDKTLTAEMGKVLNEKKILEYGGFLEGAVDFNNLKPNRLYKVGTLTGGSVGIPPEDISANSGAYSTLEFYETEGYQTQRMTQVVGGRSMMFRSRDDRNVWGEWQRSQSINTYYPTKTIENMGTAVARKVFPIVNWKNTTGSEICEILIPTSVNLGGVIELNLTSTFGNGNATGGAKVLYHVTASNKTIHSSELTIVDISEAFASQFFINGIQANDNWYYILIVKKKASSPLSIDLTYHSSGGNYSAWDVVNSTILNASYDTSEDWATRLPQESRFAKRDKTNRMFNTFPIMFNPSGMHSHVFHKAADGRLHIAPSSEVDGNVWAWDNSFIVGVDGSVHAKRVFVDGVDLKSSVSDGKAKVATAITGKGVSTSPTATFDQMATNINQISTGVPYAKGTAYTQSTTGGGTSYIRIANLGFEPKTVIGKRKGISDTGNAWSVFHIGRTFDGDLKIYTNDNRDSYNYYGAGSSGGKGSGGVGISEFWLQVDSSNGTEWYWEAFGFPNS